MTKYSLDNLLGQIVEKSGADDNFDYLSLQSPPLLRACFVLLRPHRALPITAALRASRHFSALLRLPCTHGRELQGIFVNGITHYHWRPATLSCSK
jgi:hypothetical protein